jgi:hypothetical protein
MCGIRKIGVRSGQDKRKISLGGGWVIFGSGLIGVNNQIPSR